MTTEQAPRQAGATPAAASASPYRRLLAMGLASLAVMYLLMYSMVDSIEHVYSNSNQLYMAASMTVAMVILELLLMREMYGNRRANAAILAVGSLALALLFTFIRDQTAISDRQLMKSMIPHHASAILMCNRASLRDPEVIELCEAIVQSQQEEIELMEAELQASQP